MTETYNFLSEESQRSMFEVMQKMHSDAVDEVITGVHSIERETVLGDARIILYQICDDANQYLLDEQGLVKAQNRGQAVRTKPKSSYGEIVLYVLRKQKSEWSRISEAENMLSDKPIMDSFWSLRSAVNLPVMQGIYNLQQECKKLQKFFDAKLSSEQRRDIDENWMNDYLEGRSRFTEYLPEHLKADRALFEKIDMVASEHLNIGD